MSGVASPDCSGIWDDPESFVTRQQGLHAVGEERKASNWRRAQHINIQYFLVNMKEVEIKWCPTKEMVADFMTKPLQGSPLRRLHNLIMDTAFIKKAKNPSTSKSTVIKRDNSVKAKLLKGNKTARKQVSSSSVNVMAQ